MIYETTIYDNIIFDDEVVSSTQIGELEDVIQLSDDIFSHRNSVSFSDRVTFADTTIVNGGCIHNVTLTDSFAFIEYIVPREISNLSDFLYIYDALVIPNGLLDDTLEFVEEMTGISGPGIEDTITLEDSLTYLWVGVLVSTDTLTLTDGFSGFVNDRWAVVVPVAEERP